MYHQFQFYHQVTAFLNDNPNAKLTNWPYGLKGHYFVFVPRAHQ